MNSVKNILFSLLMGLSIPLSGCMLDEVVEDGASYTVIYRDGIGYGYWYGNYWYAAPVGFRYYVGCRPYWGPHYPARPYYRGPSYRGGYGNGGYHGGFHGGRGGRR